MSTTAGDKSNNLKCMAYVVRKQDAQLAARGMVNFIPTRMAPQKAPAGGVVFCESFPPGAIGKVMKGQLKDIQGFAGSAKFLNVPV